MAILKPYIKLAFEGLIWRLEVDPVEQILLAEVRNEQEKQVSFASVDLNTGTVYFDKLTTEERWLTGMEAAHDGVLLLHHYSSANSPVHKGIIAINAITGETLWANYNQTFDYMGNAGPVVFDNRLQPRKPFGIDIQTGEPLKTTEATLTEAAGNQITVPELIDTELLQSTLNLPDAPYGNIAHNLYYKHFRIVSLHSVKNGGLTQSLYIFNNGRLVFFDLLNTGIQKLQPEAFVLHQRYLIYLKNRVELNVINLQD